MKWIGMFVLGGMLSLSAASDRQHFTIHAYTPVTTLWLAFNEPVQKDSLVLVRPDYAELVVSVADSQGNTYSRDPFVPKQPAAWSARMAGDGLLRVAITYKIEVSAQATMIELDPRSPFTER